jgi:hypothetical protein
MQNILILHLVNVGGLCCDLYREQSITCQPFAIGIERVHNII